mmetsp:Transcript_22400/g.64300  ORF Transcript_22400/g.64300 Transcript_22400/m.64300 type:complete len:350 (+) Transcript_22400:240-1289(+)
MSPPSCAVTPPMGSFHSTRKTKAAAAALGNLSNGGKSSAASSSGQVVIAQGTGSASEPKREAGKKGGLPSKDINGGLVMIEQAAPSVRLTKQPTSAPSSKTVQGGFSSSNPTITTSVSGGVLDASGTTVATDKSSTDNLVGKLIIHEADTSSDENDCGPTDAAEAADTDDLGGSRRRSPATSALAPTLQCKSSFLSAPKPPAMKKAVSFHQVHVQEYARTIGDHPDVVLGPPLSIDWEPHHHEAHEFEDYESSREGMRKASKIDMRVHPNTRNRMLISAGVSKGEIKAATKAANRVSSQRKSTVASLEAPVIVLLEEAAQSAMRKIKRRSWRSGDAKKLGESSSRSRAA